MADLEKEFNRIRACFIDRLIIFANYIYSLDDKILNDKDVIDLKLRIDKIESLYDQYDKAQLALASSFDRAKGQYYERSEFEADYFISLGKAKNLLREFGSTTDKVVEAEKSSDGANPLLNTEPGIHLRKFSGSYHEFLDFKDRFVGLIHSNEEIEDIDKFNYLRACLEDAAAEVIQPVEVSADNYATAWKLLCDRYDNKRLLVQCHVTALFRIQAITIESSITFKRLMEGVHKNLRALATLGEPIQHWDTLLIFIISQKLSQKTYRAWEEFKYRMDKNTPITFNSFMQFMHNHADLIETLEVSRDTDATFKSDLESLIQLRNSSVDAPKVCLKCNGKHRLNKCPQFLALSNDARFKLLPTYKICFNCFQTGHYANSCEKSGCKVCKRKHNTLVHVVTAKSKKNMQNKLACGSGREVEFSAFPNSIEANNIAMSAKIAATCNFRHCEVLLATALLKLYDNDNREHVVRALLDSGSTSCVVTERLCQRLNLVTRQIDRLLLGINNVVSHVGRTCRINVKSLDDAFSTNLHCFVLSFITNNVPYSEIDLTDLEIPSDICLADPTFYKHSEVDILIGADLFWDLIETQKMYLGNGSPVLCKTKLGWVISGPIKLMLHW